MTLVGRKVIGAERRGIFAELGTLGIYELSPFSSSSFLPVLALLSRELEIHTRLAMTTGGYGGEYGVVGVQGGN